MVADYVESRTSMYFVLNSLFRDAAVRQLTIAGEAAINLSGGFQGEAPGQSMAGNRRISEQDRTRLFRLQSGHSLGSSYKAPPGAGSTISFNPGGRISRGTRLTYEAVVLPRGTKFNDAEFMQYRNPVGFGPSSNT